MGISFADYLAMQARVQGKSKDAVAAHTGCECENELHEQILTECRRRVWLPFHGSMAHRTFRTEGEPDFIILCDGGKTLLVEAKTRAGKLSPAQLAVRAWAAKLGHTVHLVRSLEEFVKLEGINKSTSNIQHPTLNVQPGKQDQDGRSLEEFVKLEGIKESTLNIQHPTLNVQPGEKEQDGR